MEASILYNIRNAERTNNYYNCVSKVTELVFHGEMKQISCIYQQQQQQKKKKKEILAKREPVT